MRICDEKSRKREVGMGAPTIVKVLEQKTKCVRPRSQSKCHMTEAITIVSPWASHPWWFVTQQHLHNLARTRDAYFTCFFPVKLMFSSACECNALTRNKEEGLCQSTLKQAARLIRMLHEDGCAYLDQHPYQRWPQLFRVRHMSGCP